MARKGRPPSDTPNKRAITMTLDPDLIEWIDSQSMYRSEFVNEVLRKEMETQPMNTETPITYRIEEEMLGPEATETEARRMVELLSERGYNVEYGPAIGQDPDTIPAQVWGECLEQL